jgi:general secretion pathway protein H
MPHTMPKNRTRSRASGFTLVEIMIVMIIVVAILSLGAGALFKSSTAMRTFIREMAIRTRELRNTARLTTSTMRIVINMNEEKGHSYWIESAPGTAQLMSEEQLKELARLTSSQREDETPKSDFEQDSRIMKKPLKPPRGLFFESVEYATKEPITQGLAYIHFFPQGLAEDAAIHFTDKKNLNWTMTINPLTGRAQVYERKISLKELQAK